MLLNCSTLEKVLLNVDNVEKIEDLENLRKKFVGKNGFFTVELRNIRDISLKERSEKGLLLNSYKKRFLVAVQKKKEFLLCYEKKNTIDYFDLTLPGRGFFLGSLHPITFIILKINSFFLRLGFDVVFGLEIEDEYHNFDALNIPKHHPARAASDTFYFKNNVILRTHTSPVQVRIMENNNPPFRLITLGKVYRVDSDNTHTPMFHQLEVLVIGYDVTFTYLKWILKKFLSLFFNTVVTRFRPSYFPFTEPSAEVDVCCFKCCGSGCFLCGNTGWIELLGCGMVQPIVLDNCNINYEKFTGLAFGVGIDRLAMLYFGINDLRLNFENDVRFLKQF